MNVSETLFISLLLYEFIVQCQLTKKSRTSQVACSKFGTGYKKMGEAELQRTEKSLPLGCSMVSGTGKFVYVFLLALFMLYLASYCCDVLSMTHDLP